MGYVNYGQEIRDPFFENQPPKVFVEDLKKPYHTVRPAWFGHRRVQSDEIDAHGIYLVNRFPDPEGLLETATADFELFGKVYGIAGDRYPVVLEYDRTPCFEAYTIRANAEGCTVTAQDTEGIRRAIMELEDEMLRREGAFLPVRAIEKRPLLHRRISRCYFSPTNTPPDMVDELLSDEDFYPEEYLNRLAHDGTNGVWISGWLRELVNTSFFQTSPDAEIRIAHLRKSIAKCKRYGIRIYVFGIEPESLTDQLAALHPEMTGYKQGTRHTLCTCTKEGEEYCIEVIQRLFEKLPDLGGVLAITAGEQLTSCASGQMRRCPRCSQYGKGEILAHNIALFREGMRRAGTGAEFISWTYGFGHEFGWTEDDIRQYVRLAPEDVPLMQNFENGGVKEQLGKPRMAMDYWLSYPGPAPLMEMIAKEGREHGKTVYAKMQISCSHELETVPYIPVPGLLYPKFKFCEENGVTGFVGCWLLGNWHGLMFKAASMLSFSNDFTDKRAFLEHLAATYYGRSMAGAVANAWQLFEEGYFQYPTNIMFAYYGPMHDGVAWEMFLAPRGRSLPRSWHAIDFPGGDRIHDCLQQGHTLDEAIVLCEAMRNKWHEGVLRLPDGVDPEHTSVCRSLDVLFDSGCNILRFYQLREKMLDGEGDMTLMLTQMRLLVQKEITNARKMIGLCRADSRIGYASHAHAYKFHPQKLEWRIGRLQHLLETEFTQAERNIAAGLPPIDYSSVPVNGICQMARGVLEDAAWHMCADGLFSYRVAYDRQKLYLELLGRAGGEFCCCWEFRQLWPTPAFAINKTGLFIWPSTQDSVCWWNIPPEEKKYLWENLSDEEHSHWRITMDRALCGWTKDTPIRLRVAMDRIPAVNDPHPTAHLGKDFQSPGEFELLLP